MVYELLLDQIKSWITGENKIAEDLDEDDDEDYGEQAEDVGRLAELLISTEEWNETRWRQTGHNSNRRGAGTGRSTHFNNEKKKVELTQQSFKLECEDSGTFFDDKCCAKYVLSQEPDFLEQMEWLEGEVIKLGFKIIFYPKYHCELNFIEKVWGYLKCYHRQICNYNYKDLIDERRGLANTMLHILPISTVRKFSRHCFRFMDAYRQINKILYVYVLIFVF